MAISYDPHLQRRLREREIPQQWPRDIIQYAVEHYRDTATGLYIAVDRKDYKGEPREMAVAYARRGREIRAITIHPIRERQKRARIATERWVPA